MVESNKKINGLDLDYVKWLYAKGHITFDAYLSKTAECIKLSDRQHTRKSQTLMQQYEEFQRLMGQVEAKLDQLMCSKTPVVTESTPVVTESRAAKLSRTRTKSLRMTKEPTPRR
jgi:hypothetical protein